METIETASLDTMGQRIRALRKANGLTMNQLAELVDAAQSTISRIEIAPGIDGVSTHIIQSICEQFGCSMDWLVSGRGPNPLCGSPIDGVVGSTKPSGIERMRVFNFSYGSDLKYVINASANKFQMGDLLIVDLAAVPERGDDIVAMVDGDIKLMRLLNPMGSMSVVEHYNGGSSDMFDAGNAAWMGVVSGTLSNKRVRTV
ncbi:helix-turn-helix domain-containing protein [Aeromonas sobria]|uniref:helix-turn-helix domain-containing protein n=1 Tax=Aeromonas sobria TaxID=646 RepID=UPI0011DF1D3D|nr:helix-turn-helix domain-containing protein [Aeromonas sobria]